MCSIVAFLADGTLPAGLLNIFQIPTFTYLR